MPNAMHDWMSVSWHLCLFVCQNGSWAAQLAKSSWAGSSAWIGYMTWIKALMCRSARASGFCGPGGLGCCSEASKYCRGCDLIPPFDRDFDSDSDATLGSGWFVQTVGHRRTEPGQAIAPASYVNDSGRDRHRHCACSACAQKVRSSRTLGFGMG